MRLVYRLIDHSFTIFQTSIYFFPQSLLYLRNSSDDFFIITRVVSKIPVFIKFMCMCVSSFLRPQQISVHCRPVL